METHLLEINLISAQALKPIPGRQMQTFAVAWVDQDTKLRTRIDRVGGENPTWNDKFIFRVSADFLARETAAVTVEIYSVGFLKNIPVGTVRILVSNILAEAAAAGNAGPAFTALQIRRRSGRIHGVLNVAAMVVRGSEFGSLTAGASSAIGYRDLMGESFRRPPRRSRSEQCSLSRVQSMDSISLAGDSSDGGDSWASSPSSATAAEEAPLKDGNGVRECVKSDGMGALCRMAMRRRMRLSPSEPNLPSLAAATEEPEGRGMDRPDPPDCSRSDDGDHAH